MTNKQRKTAIEWLQEEIRSLRLAPKINGCGPENWADLLEIMETCLEAVRAYHKCNIDQEEIKPCELCGGESLDSVGFRDYYGFRVYLSGGIGKPPENERFQFCPKCGRPLTDETVDMMLERWREAVENA